MQNTKPIVWTKKLSVNIKEIDEQHQYFISIINELLSAFKNRVETDSRIIRRIIRELKSYSDYHFNEEEKYFEKFDYKESKKHKKDHEKMKQEIEKIILHFRIGDKDNTKSSIALVKLMDAWLTKHFKEDKKYAKCFHDHGLY